VLLALLSAAALALAACGHDETATGTTPSASPGTTEASTDTSPYAAVTDDGTMMAVSYSEPPYPPAGKAIAAGTVGWLFKPTVDIEVTALGCFDAYQDGLAHKHRVGIFDAHTGQLVASVTIGRTSALEGAFRWEPLRGKAVEVDGQLSHASSCILRAGHAYVVGTRADPGVEEPGAYETLYEEDSWTEEWAPAIRYGGLRSNLGSDVAFSAPTNPRTVWAMIPIAWMSPNFMFRAVSDSSSATSLEQTGDQHTPSGPQQSTLVLDDGVYRWNDPGSASLTQTLSVAERYAGTFAAGKIPSVGLYVAHATLDYWSQGRQARGIRGIRRTYRELASEADEHPFLSEEEPGWNAARRSKQYHLLAAPGVAMLEGMLQFSNSSDSGPYLALLAVDGDKIAHEEVFDGAGQPVAPFGSAPGSGDTAEVAARVGARVGAAIASHDWAVLRVLLARDVLFRDTASEHDVRGAGAVLSWWRTVAPAKKLKVKNRAPIAGPGWAVVRWTSRRTHKDGYLPGVTIVESRNGATVIEVRDGQVVRMTLYLEPGEGGGGSILQAIR
jgi:hypothetical protein